MKNINAEMIQLIEICAQRKPERKCLSSLTQLRGKLHYCKYTEALNAECSIYQHERMGACAPG